jgi:transcriptional regulator
MLYTPTHFAVDRREFAAALIRAHPFATLISQGTEEPFVTHAPLLLDASGERWRLLGHVARANPHWEAWRDGSRVLAVFHGADSYVSPSLYSTRKAVPTWNYMVVHASGTIGLSHDSEGKERVLKALIDAHDPPYHAQWNELDLTYREGMKQGIVAFTISVERIDAKFKLSQNRPQDDRERVRQAMQAGGDRGRELADWMQRLSDPAAR